MKKTLLALAVLFFACVMGTKLALFRPQVIDREASFSQYLFFELETAFGQTRFIGGKFYFSFEDIPDYDAVVFQIAEQTTTYLQSDEFYDDLVAKVPDNIVIARHWKEVVRTSPPIVTLYGNGYFDLYFQLPTYSQVTFHWKTLQWRFDDSPALEKFWTSDIGKACFERPFPASPQNLEAVAAVHDLVQVRIEAEQALAEAEYLRVHDGVIPILR